MLPVAAMAAVTVAGAGLLARTGRPAPFQAGPCPPVTTPLRADIDGDGCASAVTWSGTVLEVEGRRYQMGQPGDHVLLGDWNCDGRDTPALYRVSGQVFVFDAWADDARAQVATSRAPHPAQARPEVRRGDYGCDRLAVP